VRALLGSATDRLHRRCGKIQTVTGPELPILSRLPPGAIQQLDSRLHNLPVDRIQTMADFYALLDVEKDHVQIVARQYNLMDTERQPIETWWLHQIQILLDSKIRDLGDRQRASFERQMTKHNSRRLRFRSNVLFQLWFNSVGPGGRTWFGNRYVTIRHYSFRLHWRP
jgi:hypothetical protein